MFYHFTVNSCDFSCCSSRVRFFARDLCFLCSESSAFTFDTALFLKRLPRLRRFLVYELHTLTVVNLQMLALFGIRVSLQFVKCLYARIFHRKIIQMKRVTKSNDSPFDTMYHASMVIRSLKHGSSPSRALIKAVCLSSLWCLESSLTECQKQGNPCSFRAVIFSLKS
jgi:hypothetical protein